MSRADTPLGRELRETIAAGSLVSDEILAEIIKSRTSSEDYARGYILDGFPRTLNQASLLEELGKRQVKRIVAVRIAVPRESLIKRLTGRRTCTKCGEIYNIFYRPPAREGFCDLDGAPLEQRSDDNEESVERRLAAYEASTAPLIDYYRRSGRLIEVDGERPVQEVFERLSEAIDV
jgi:adenylate kinase